MPLKFTKNQTLILEIFYSHPEKLYYLRELAQMMGKEPGVFQKDINKLVEEGFLENYYKTKRRFFKINKKYPFYNELKSIFFKTVGVKGRLQKELKGIKGVKEAFIYGSFARGEEKESSDIDLFIIGSADEDEILDLIDKLENKFGREINYILMNEKEFQKKLKEKNSFLENILSQKRIKLI
jgi:predicted nucleotidyltransferase